VTTLHVYDDDAKTHRPAKALVVNGTASKSDAFSRSTPTGNLSMTITNPAAAKVFKDALDRSPAGVDIDMDFYIPIIEGDPVSFD
jgi:hypothetical protein